MKPSKPHFLLLEPYYGGSHRSFLKGLRKHSPFGFTLMSLPARKWKMRMQLAAPWFAEKVAEHITSGGRCDGILCSTFLDSALLRVLLCRQNIHLPMLVYFHENQFAYPDRVPGPAQYQFTALNFTTALAADGLAFNSRYNRDTFFQGIEKYLKRAADMNIMHQHQILRSKAKVLHPGIDYEAIDRQHKTTGGDVPVIVWNHRWEHDKDPETFFKALYTLTDRDVDFRLIVLGQSFARKPAVFAEARDRLRKNIIHFGYARKRDEYARLLRRGDIIVSTARHEFFGMAVLEAVRAGCFPIVPDRLAYNELFPKKYRYSTGTLKQFLMRRLLHWAPLPEQEVKFLTEKYSWPNMAEAYQAWLASVL